MKELEKIQKDQVENVRQVEVKKVKTNIARVVPGEGHKLFEFNRSTYEMRIVKVPKQKTIAYEPKKKLEVNQVYIPHDGARQKFETKENCSYIYALNTKNAIKKVHKRYKHIPFVKFVDEL